MSPQTRPRRRVTITRRSVVDDGVWNESRTRASESTGSAASPSDCTRARQRLRRRRTSCRPRGMPAVEPQQAAPVVVARRRAVPLPLERLRVAARDEHAVHQRAPPVLVPEPEHVAELVRRRHRQRALGTLRLQVHAGRRTPACSRPWRLADHARSRRPCASGSDQQPRPAARHLDEPDGSAGAVPGPRGDAHRVAQRLRRDGVRDAAARPGAAEQPRRLRGRRDGAQDRHRHVPRRARALTRAPARSPPSCPAFHVRHRRASSVTSSPRPSSRTGGSASASTRYWYQEMSQAIVMTTSGRMPPSGISETRGAPSVRAMPCTVRR